MKHAAMAGAVYSVSLLAWQQGLGGLVVTTQVKLMQVGTVFRHLGETERVEAVVKRADHRRRLVPFGAMIALGGIVILIHACWGQLTLAL